MTPEARIFVAGHRGLVGSAVVRRLEREGFRNVLTRTRQELDLTNAASVRSFFAETRPEVVFLCAAKVGGILANHTYPADFLRENLLIQLSVFDAAREFPPSKLVFLGSSCIYPKLAPQPIREEYLLTGPLEPTNEPYALAKIAGLKMAEAYRRQHGLSAITLMPTNLYGPGDNFDLLSSHVLPAMIRKFHEAREAGAVEVLLWGSGTPKREFLHVDDLADACLHFARSYDGPDPINVGTGTDVSIAELARLVASVVGYQGAVAWDRSKPDGTPRKLLDVSKATALGWTARTELREGIASTYGWYRAHGAEPKSGH